MSEWNHLNQQQQHSAILFVFVNCNLYLLGGQLRLDNMWTLHMMAARTLSSSVGRWFLAFSLRQVLCAQAVSVSWLGHCTQNDCVLHHAPAAHRVPWPRTCPRISQSFYTNYVYTQIAGGDLLAAITRTLSL